MLTSNALKQQILERLGFIPPFFEPAFENPTIFENLWRQTEAAYLDNPLPKLFKEKLAAMLARFCAVPYCLMCHSASLRPLGLKSKEVLKLLESPATDSDSLQYSIAFLNTAGPCAWPEPASAAEAAILSCSIAVFLNHRVEETHTALRRHLSSSDYDLLVFFIGYNKVALNWAEAHPELSYERDERYIKYLKPVLDDDPELKKFFASYQQNSLKQASRQLEWLSFENRKLLEVERERLYSYFAQAPVGFAILKEPEHQFVMANAMFERFMGVKDFRGKAIRAVITEDGYNDFFKLLDEAYLTGRGVVEIEREVMPNVFVNIAVEPYRNEANKIAGLLVLVTDISDQILARNVADVAQAKLQTMLAQMPIGVCLFEGQDHRYVFVNDLYYSLFDRPRNLLGKTVTQVLPEIAEREIVRMLDKVYQTGEPFQASEYPVDLMQADGSVRHRVLDFAYKPTRSADGTIIGIVATIIDVTAQVAARRMVEESERRLRTLCDAMPQIVWEANAEGILVYTNIRWTEYSGSNDPAIWHDFVHPNDRPRVIREWTKSVSTGSIYETKFRILRKKDQSYRWHLVRAEAVKDGNERKWYGTCTDIDLQQNLELQLNLAKEVAESANETKSAFLANMSHEIRTPLSAIMGFAELLQQPNLPIPERDECLTTILRNSDHLLNLVNDILDLSKVESGKMELDEHLIESADLINEVQFLLSKKAANKGLVFTIVPNGEIPRFLQTDPTRLKQILINVIGNAIKFTSDGHVKVSTRLVPTSPKSEACLAFVIEDTGCGMRLEHISRLFDPFIQADSSTTRKYGGTGLGLALSKKLARALGGDLRLIRTAPGAGSVFEITLPLGDISGVEMIQDFQSPQGRIRTKGSQRMIGSLKEKRILVVEDTVDNQRLISRYMRSAGAEVELAADGAQGVKKGLQDSFDAILMDIQMPVLDGIQATKQLRSGGYRGPVLALTAHAMIEEKNRCLEAGCTDVIIKPIDYSLLIDTLVRRIEGPSHSSTEAEMDDEFIADILGTFIFKTFPTLLQTIKDEIESGNTETVAKSAHMIMGSIAVYKERELGPIAKDLEQEAKGAASKVKMKSVLEQLALIQGRLSKKYIHLIT